MFVVYWLFNCECFLLKFVEYFCVWVVMLVMLIRNLNVIKK